MRFRLGSMYYEGEKFAADKAGGPQNPKPSPLIPNPINPENPINPKPGKP